MKVSQTLLKTCIDGYGYRFSSLYPQTWMAPDWLKKQQASRLRHLSRSRLGMQCKKCSQSHLKSHCCDRDRLSGIQASKTTRCRFCSLKAKSEQPAPEMQPYHSSLVFRGWYPQDPFIPQTSADQVQTRSVHRLEYMVDKDMARRPIDIYKTVMQNL